MNPSPPPRVRILVAGLGSIGRRHVRLLAERPEVDLIVCDPVSERRADVLAGVGRPAAEFADYDDALAAGAELVFICTPNQQHSLMGEAAIAAGVEVFVEKPVAETVAEAMRLVVAAESAGCRLHVGYMLRFDPGLQAVKRLIDAGGIGTPCSGRAMLGSYVTLLNSRDRHKEVRPGSLVVDYTHEIDFIRWILGEISGVQAAGATLGDLERRAQPNIFQAILTLASGALVQLHLDYVQYPQRRIFEVYGDRGTVSYDFMTGEIRHFGFEREHGWRSLDVAPLVSRVDDLFRAEHAAVLGSHANGTAPTVDGRAGLAALRVAETALEAAARSAPLWVEGAAEGVIPRIETVAP